MRGLTKGLLKHGCDVIVRMPWSEEASENLSRWEPVDTTSVGQQTVGALGYSRAYTRQLMAQEADILHTQGLWQHPSWVALKWRKKWHKPHVVSVRGMLEPWAWNHHRWKKLPVWHLWEQRNLAGASLLHATSEQEAESFRARGLRTPIAIIPNGVYMPGDAFQKEESPSSKRVALFLSRIHPKKGLPLLIEAWARVRPENWELHIVGPDEMNHRAELAKRVAKHDLDESVIFKDPVSGDAKTRLFQQSSLFVLPTYSENFGIAVAEAMAHQLPVITTHGAPWKVLDDERCGWWVPATADAITRALEQAIQCDADELSSMGQRGQAVVRERFSWDKIAYEMMQCYLWLHGKASQPDCVVTS